MAGHWRGSRWGCCQDTGHSPAPPQHTGQLGVAATRLHPCCSCGLCSWCCRRLYRTQHMPFYGLWHSKWKLPTHPRHFCIYQCLAAWWCAPKVIARLQCHVCSCTRSCSTCSSTSITEGYHKELLPPAHSKTCLCAAQAPGLSCGSCQRYKPPTSIPALLALLL